VPPESSPSDKRNQILMATPSQKLNASSPIGNTFIISKAALSPLHRQRRYLYTKYPARPSRRLTWIKVLGPHGRAVRSTLPRLRYHHIALGATLRAAAPFQVQRSQERGETLNQLLIEPWDLRFQVCCGPVMRLVIFVVDASGSMGAHNRMTATKGAILSLLGHAYQYREKVGLITFRGEEARANLGPTWSVELAKKHLEKLPTGGTTPLPAGLESAYKIIERERLREPALLPLLILVTDGRANIPLRGEDAVQDAYQIACFLRKKGVHSIVLNTDPYVNATPPPLRKTLILARKLGGKYYHLKDLEQKSMATIVTKELGCITKATH
jgi:magnesium chelatase subunit D